MFVLTAAVDQPVRGAGGVRPSLSTSGETLTIKESMSLNRARTENAGNASETNTNTNAAGAGG